MKNTRQKRWHKEHLRTITAKLPCREYDLFREACRMQGTTAYAALCALARAYIYRFPPVPPGEMVLSWPVENHVENKVFRRRNAA